MHITTRIAVTALALATLLVPANPAGARDTEELIADLGICFNRCSIDSQGCNQSCCGLLFCRKRCILGCDDSLNACKATCQGQVFGSMTNSAFFDTATLAHGGRTLRVAGPLSCAGGATADVAVTITQRSTGAVARGRIRQRCDAAQTTFALGAQALRGAPFDTPGSAQACGAVRLRSPGRTGLDAFQWCRTITLVPADLQLEE